MQASNILESKMLQFDVDQDDVSAPTVTIDATNKSHVQYLVPLYHPSAVNKYYLLDL